MTEQGRMEEQLSYENLLNAFKESEQRYRAMFENMKSGIATYQPVDNGRDFVFKDLNSAAERISHIRKEDAIGRRLLEILPNMDKVRLLACLRRVWQTGRPERIPVFHYEDEQRKGWRDYSVYKLPSGEIVAIYDDVTGRKDIEEELAASNERYQSLYRMIRLMCDNVPDLIWAKDMDKRFIFTNRTTREKLLNARDTEEPIGKNDLFFAQRERAEHPDCPDWHTFGEICRDSDTIVMSSRRPDRFDESGNVRGEFLYLDVHKAPFFDEQGEMIGTVGCGRDVTRGKQLAEERKRAQEAFSHSEQLWKFALEGARDGVWDWNTQTNEVFFSSQWKTMLGYEEHEIGNTLDEWDGRVHPDDKAQCYADLKRHLSGETPFYENQHRMQCKDGTYKWILDRGKVTEWSEEGKPLRVLGTHTDISAQKRLEAELSEKTLLLEGLLDSIPDIVFFKDMDGVYLGCNPEFARFVGRDKAKIVGHTDYDLFDKQVADDFRRNDRLMMDQGMARHNEERIDYPDGDRALIDTFKAPLRSINGEIIGVLGISRDITERKRMEESLRESEGRFRGMFESHSAVMFLIDPVTGEIVDANNAAELLYGYTASQLRSMSIQDINILPPDEVEREFNLAIQERRNYFIFPHRLASGEVRTVEVHSSPIEQHGDKYLFSIIHDITERKRLEGEVKQAAEKFRTVADFTYDWEYWIAPDGSIIYISPACERITGYCADEFTNNSGLIQEIIHPEDRAFVADHVASIDSGPPHQSEFRIVTRSGETHWIGHVCQAVYGADGTWLGRRVSNRDITDLKKAERKLVELNEELERKVTDRTAELTNANRQLLTEIQEHADTASSLRDSEKSVRMIIESSPIGIFVIQDQKYSFVNQAFMKIFGLTDYSEVIGKHPETPYGDDSGKRIRSIFRQCVDRSEMTNVTDLNALTLDQRELHLNIWLQPTEFWGSSAVIGFMIDVSEELELRAHLNQAQKMEALGSLAGGIAHDFNNVLFAITGYTELALSSAPAGSKLNKQLGQVLGAAGRAAELVKHILTFSREREQEKKPLIIGPIVKESLNFLRASITQNIEIRRNISSDLHTVNGDPTQIHQIIMNLVTNAYHAMKNTGGTIGVSLDEVDLSPDFVKARPGMLPGTYQRLRVSDTGHGMSPETLKRIFDPYFTTKEVGQGTGLGLSVVDSIVRDHGGAITVQSVPDEGTTFEVYLPIIMDKNISSEATEKAAPLGKGRILFVDDETMVTEATRSNLENLGYKVHAENDPVRALARFEAEPYSFDLVITDMSMPKMTGLQLSRKISQIREDLPIILISGFSDLLDDHNLSDYGIRELIHKPIRKVMLAQAISNILTKQDH
jgi:PAS domain S-box-containing protein